MMKTWRGTLGCLAASLVAAAVLAQGTGANKPKTTHKSSAKTPVIWPAGDLKWTNATDAPPGVKQVTLWGDSTKGAFGGIYKFPPGFSAALHTHSHEVRIVTVSGTIIHGPEGKPEVRIPAGSYLLEPATYRHTTGCDKASECVFFMESNGKFDIKMVEKKKASAKK
jgi:quercetin dioxygenase-like cupin family protein